MNLRALSLAVLLLSATLTYAQFSGQHRADTPFPSQTEPFPGSDPANPNPDSIRTFTGTITGSVVTVGDRPVADARVEIRTLGGATLVGTVYSNATGAFEIGNIPAGTYEVTAYAGIRETHQRLDVQSTQNWITLRMAPEDEPSSAGGRTSVSVTQMQVPEKARKEYKKAVTAMDERKLDEAHKYAAKALEIEPNFAEALTLTGILDLQQGQAESARVELEKAVHVDGNYGMAYVALGSAYNALRRFGDAIRVLGRGIDLLPDAWQGYFERARALERQQQWELSLHDIVKAAQLVGKDFPVLHLVKANDLIGLRAYPEAQAELQAYLDKESTGPNADEARRVLEQVKTFMASAKR